MLLFLLLNYSLTFWTIQKSHLSGHVEQPSPRLSIRASSGSLLFPRRRVNARGSGCPGRPSCPVASPGSAAAADLRRRGAPRVSKNSTYEYYLEAEEIPEVNAVVCVVDAATQVSCPPSAASSPRPLVGVRIEAIITGAEPVFQASCSHAARSSPPPSAVYPDSAPRVRRRPPQTLFVRRHTRSSDEPLLPPLLTDRCLLVCILEFS